MGEKGEYIDIALDKDERESRYTKRVSQAENGSGERA